MTDNGNNGQGPSNPDGNQAGGVQPRHRPPITVYPPYGICNNRVFLGHFLGESPLIATLKFAPLNRWPVLNPYTHKHILSMAYVYGEVRYNSSDAPNPSLRRAIPIGETLAPLIDQTKFASTDESRASFLLWMKKAFLDDIFDAMGDYNQQTYTELRESHDAISHWDPDEMLRTYPPTEVQIETMTFPQAWFYAYYISKHLRSPNRQLALEYITHAYCALGKRGQVTDEFCTKITNAVRDELGVNVVLHSGTLNSLYKSYMQGVNENNAAGMFNYLQMLVPAVALRLQLTLMQASGSGLTLYSIIGRAIRLYNNFPWGLVNTLTSGELVNWNGARVLIGDNMYYGFKRDLGAARSTLYKSLGYVARELLVRINGENTLRRFMGLTGNVKNKRQLDQLIEAYVAGVHVERQVDDAAERALVPLPEILQGNVLFV
ncbi:hypothetical protein [Hubei chuvirus-like virus 1]|uniref:Uncharacterized protein n=1 Tax=Hubei chuvirus-like virus 1 TaxID=1922857 RepID=A0A1L3KMV7_9VIRU|nr:hypothetical protein [Hubei chuvirus-like virus 1]APG78718.1 hypothetical protein [Hubei chuvirus-like virus 1]